MIQALFLSHATPHSHFPGNCPSEALTDTALPTSRWPGHLRPVGPRSFGRIVAVALRRRSPRLASRLGGGPERGRNSAGAPLVLSSDSSPTMRPGAAPAEAPSPCSAHMPADAGMSATFPMDPLEIVAPGASCEAEFFGLPGFSSVFLESRPRGPGDAGSGIRIGVFGLSWFTFLTGQPDRLLPCLPIFSPGPWALLPRSSYSGFYASSRRRGTWGLFRCRPSGRLELRSRPHALGTCDLTPGPSTPPGIGLPSRAYVGRPAARGRPSPCCSLHWPSPLRVGPVHSLKQTRRLNLWNSPKITPRKNP